MGIAKLPCYSATLRQAARAMTKLYDAHLASLGIRSTQFIILQTLEIKAGARITDLESILAMDQTTLTRTLALLSKRNLIEVAERPSGREKCWGLTKAGAATLTRARPLWESAQLEVRTRMGSHHTKSLHQHVYELAATFG